MGQKTTAPIKSTQQIAWIGMLNSNKIKDGFAFLELYYFYEQKSKLLLFQQLIFFNFNHPSFYNLSMKTNFVLQLFIWPNKKYSNLQNIGKS
jgi:hypothetical protein